MLPATDHGPPRLPQRKRVRFVASTVAIDLRNPVVKVGLRGPGMPIASMPEAAVDEDGDAATREGNVDMDARSSAVDPEVDSVPKAVRMES